MSDIALSFCIPTYNRSEIVYKNVLDILACPDLDIEVVVLDNGSTDSTLNLLNSIQDKRLVIYANGENKGVLYNILNALDKGKGKYVVFSTDKDSFKPEAISDFKKFLLSQERLAAGFCEFNSDLNVIHQRFSQGAAAVRAVAYQARHPTGYFFNNEILKSIKLVDRFSDHSMVDTFPFDFVFGELCLLGDGYIYYPDLISLESGTMAAKIKSFGTDGKKKDAFFSPESRLRMALNFSQHIQTLNFSQKEKNILIADVFVRGIVGATSGYRGIMKNKYLCEHYGMAPRNVGNMEVLKLGIDYFSNFIHESTSIFGISNSSKFAFLMNVSSLMIKKTFIKIGNFFK